MSNTSHSVTPQQVSLTDLFNLILLQRHEAPFFLPLILAQTTSVHVYSPDSFKILISTYPVSNLFIKSYRCTSKVNTICISNALSDPLYRWTAVNQFPTCNLNWFHVIHDTQFIDLLIIMRNWYKWKRSCTRSRTRGSPQKKRKRKRKGEFHKNSGQTTRNTPSTCTKWMSKTTMENLEGPKLRQWM